MDAKDLRQQLTKAQITRLKQLGKSIKVAKVLGPRVLVKTVQPYTEMDDVEKKGLLYIPEKVKEQNTPLPTTGIVVGVGQLKPPYDLWLKEGAMIAFPKFSGSDMVIEEQDYRIVDAVDVLCILEGVDEVVPVKGARE